MEDFADAAALQARWQEEKAAWLAYVAGLTSESLNQGYEGDPAEGPKLWQTIVHVVNHGTQRRSICSQRRLATCELAYLQTQNARICPLSG